MIVKLLKIEDKNYINQCDELLIKLLNEEKKYDNNYKKNNNLKSFEKDLKKENNFLIVTIDNEKVVGFLFGYVNYEKSNQKNAVANLSFIYVDEEYRNKKIGSSLIEYYINLLKNKNIRFVEVKCFNDNIYAKKLYKKYEFGVLWQNYRKIIK